MANSTSPSELLEHICNHSSLNSGEADRLVQEILAFYDESAASFVRRRHHELQKSGMSNSDIYEFIARELTHHRFTSDPMTIRQIRRTIYG
ncbi:MAG: hypothetical protein ACI9UN_000457 [Granulosicoccus sp.]|jgi:hypothetical protein